MRNALHPSSDRQAGFTLVELLVVILIIGILASIALPAFLDQQAKGQDARAKSDARALASEVEACYTSGTGFAGCAAELRAGGTGLPVGSGVGQVDVTDELVDGYEITAISESSQAGSNHRFIITHNIGGVFSRTCTAPGDGGCRDNGTW